MVQGTRYRVQGTWYRVCGDGAGYRVREVDREDLQQAHTMHPSAGVLHLIACTWESAHASWDPLGDTEEPLHVHAPASHLSSGHLPERDQLHVCMCMCACVCIYLSSGHLPERERDRNGPRAGEHEGHVAHQGW